MRFKELKIALILCVVLCSYAFAVDAPGLQRISDRVYAYVDIKNASPAQSFGANTGLIIGRDAALVIDTLVSAKEADRFLADIRKVTDKPVKYVVNTHYHLDHAWGNCRFAKLGALVIEHENARPNIRNAAESLANPAQYGLTAKDLEGTTLQAPNITFTGSMTIDLGDVSVELQYPGPSHTNDSITAYIPQDKVIFVGDNLFTRYHPFLGEGDIGSWQKVLTELQNTPAEKIIPGHGPVSGKADIEKMKVCLREFDTLAATLCRGKSAADAPGIAQEMLKRLPDQQRTELPTMVEFNLRAKYLPQPESKKQ